MYIRYFYSFRDLDCPVTPIYYIYEKSCRYGKVAGSPLIVAFQISYYEYFSEEIRKLKALLEEEIDSGDLKSDILKTTKKLKTWVNNTPLYLQLQWFDTVEQVEISTKLRKRRWNTEVTACDTLYLQKIGLYQK